MSPISGKHGETPTPNSEKQERVRPLGFIVNPIAGMGGAVGLKGTDKKEILTEALKLGAKPVAPARAKAFLAELNLIGTSVRLVVGAGRLGEDEVKDLGLKYLVVGESKNETAAEDTMQVARFMVDEHVGLLVFCGGDGTARDVFNAVEMKLPVLGVPTGVKMHSAVFAVTPQAAARVASGFLSGNLPLHEAEVMDVDEKAFRGGRLSAALYGYVLSPYEPHLVQANKLASPITEGELRNQAAIAVYIIEEMKPGIIYIIGPGTTTRNIADLLDAKKTLLGVDLFLNKQLIASDVNESQILEAIGGKDARIIVTPIGGQGFVFGRGNQQLSPRVIREVGLENVIVIATESKLRGVRSLKVDTGDTELDDAIKKNEFKVVTDYKTERRIKVE